ncbi:MAG: uroporphyrinogen decarboxylase family protein [Candidatus Latescibacteria bacterium]|jgi:uroporphyrinogen-III decarboxylase|nr:uroporphyrinogen decarboxylase family protein [Candidatus Latescibacterota bacterium]
MTARENFKKALNHETPNTIPVDFGSAATTGMHVSCVGALRDYYGLEKRPVKVHEPYQMLGWIDDDLKEATGITIDGLQTRNTLFGFPNVNWREFRLPWGQEVLVSEHFQTTTDTKGDLLLYPEGDQSAPPSARMPVGGAFFDTIIRQEPIDDSTLNPEDNLEEFSIASEADISHVQTEVERLKDSPYGRTGTFGGTGFGDIALVTAPFLTHPKGIRDVEEWYISTFTRQDYIHKVFERQCEIGIQNLETFHNNVGDTIDVLFVCGTDFGTQTSTFCSTDTFDSLYAPYYKQVNDWVHQHTSWKTLKHSCGAVESFIPHFIETGFDILNPVQCSATGMDPQTLKDRYGDRIVFWGGGVDTQQTLPFGTADEVREQVLQRCEIFSPNGGFIFNSIHNVQMNTPVENIVAMIDAVKTFNGRS